MSLCEQQVWGRTERSILLYLPSELAMIALIDTDAHKDTAYKFGILYYPIMAGY